ncbi:MAG: hypothetical protein DFNUSKGM_003113 [Candidatus Fervidibacter sacchari]
MDSKERGEKRMNRLLATLTVIAVLLVGLLLGIVIFRRGQPPAGPPTPVGEQAEQKETIAPSAPKWQQHRKEK